MNLTPLYSLPCPAPEDYAAIALYMQRLAETFEAKILDERAMVADFASQPMGLWANSGNLTVASGGFIGNISIDSPIYTNTPSVATTGFTPGPFTGMFPEAGVYHVGWNVTMSEIGAVNANTFRTIVFLMRQVAGDGTEIALLNISRRVMSSVVSGERFGSDGLMVVNEANRPLINARIEFTSGNTSSSTRIGAGLLRGWYRKLGSTSQIEVL